MQLARSLLFNALMYLAMLVMGILGAPLALWSVDGAYRVMHAYCDLVIWMARVIVGLSVEVRGEAPEGACLVCAKHQSFFDILILAAHLPRFKFIMKAELKWAPVLGLYAMRIGSTPVRRGEKSRAMQKMVADVEAEHDSAGQLVIYPQGTRVAPGAKMPYKIGAGVLYQRGGVVCVPAATNVGVFWPRRGVMRRPGVAVVAFLEPIPPGLPPERFMARIEEEIETHSDRLMREAGLASGPSP